MRVLHVNNQARFHGGVERILFDIADSLGDYGDQGLLFTQGGSADNFDAPFAWLGMSLEEAIEDFRPDVALIHKVDDADLIARVSALLPTQVFVHDHDLTCPRKHKYVVGSDRACARKAGVSCLTNLCFVERAPADNLIPVTLFDGIRRQTSQLKAVKSANGLIVASQAMRDELIQNGVTAGRISVISPIPKSTDDIQSHQLSAAPNLLFVGQVIRGKGVDLLLKAMKKLPEDVTLTVVGDGSHLTACKKLATQLQIHHRVTFTGWVSHEQLDQYYGAAQLLVVPSRWPEPFGMVGVEAMARGRPVVAFDTGGIREWLHDGENGLLANPGDVSDLARNVLNLISNHGERQAMSQRASESVRQNFNHSRFVGELYEHLWKMNHESADLRLCRG